MKSTKAARKRTVAAFVFLITMKGWHYATEGRQKPKNRIGNGNGKRRRDSDYAITQAKVKQKGATFFVAPFCLA